MDAQAGARRAVPAAHKPHGGVLDRHLTTGKDDGESLRTNNFDLIRLIAALQVLAVHAIEHLGVDQLREVDVALAYLPGVPVFFVISGFLISMSWERAPSLRQYLWNRALRIYPALWICLIFSIGVFLASGVRAQSSGSLFLWVLAQVTFVQFYNPSFLRNFGVGVLNGSLWTIVVELQFYLLLPLLSRLSRRFRSEWVILTIASLFIMLVGRSFIAGAETLPQKLLGVSLVVYLFFFLIGVIARHVYQNFRGVFRGKVLIWALIYLLWVMTERAVGISGAGGNMLNPVSIVLIAALTVSAAFSYPGLSSKLLRGGDISYGVYIYHMPLLNLLLFHGITGGTGFAIVLVSTLVAALASWRLVEQPALTLKRYSMRE